MGSVSLLSLGFLLFVGLALSAIIPSDVKRCQRDDPKFNDCAIRTANAIVPSLIDGNEDYAIPVLDPFLIQTVALSERNGQGLDLALTFANVKIKGIKGIVIEDGSKLDLEKRTMELKASIPTLTLEATYEVDGRVLVLPIKGAGEGNLTVGNLKLTFDTDFTLHKDKNGNEYAQLANSKLDFTLEHFNIYLANLFNGDKTLGDQMNVFLNENWRDVVKEFGPVLRETIKTIVLSVVNNVALRVPYDVLFPK